MKINICIPSKRAPMNLITVQCLFDLVRANRQHDIEVLIDTSLGIDAARNKLIEKSKDADYILFVDADMAFKPNSLRRLLSHNRDIVSGLYFSRGFPYNPCAYLEKKETNGYEWITGKLEGLNEVDSTGFGFILIKKKVFDIMKKPYFSYDYQTKVSEDIWFCRKAKKAGYKIYLDCNVKLGHFTERPVTIRDWKKVRPGVKI